MFFIVWVRSGFRPVGMPSRVVDDLWHEFICDTRAYASFCQRAFGRFFHHVPASDEPVEGDDPVALRRTWRWACLVEGMDPRRPKQLPKLFAVDARLAVAGGFAFHLTWQGANWSGDDESKSACGGGGGGCSGLATADGPAACGGGCSGGGGGGCGGGCGGG
jgi:hypothetical protein